MRKLILHIGGGKTGSSAIQHFLASNRTKLNEFGVGIPTHDLKPKSRVTGEHVWYFNKIRKLNPGDASALLRRDLKPIGFSQNSNIHTIILSAENLSDPHRWNTLFSPLRDEYDIEIIFYIRRQDDYLISAWQQWYAKINDDFWPWILSNVGSKGDWLTTINDYAQFIPDDKMNIGLFQRASLKNGNVVEDFISKLGASFADYDGWKEVNNESNSSVNLAIQDIVEKNQHLFENSHDNGFYNFILEYSPSAKKTPNHTLLSFDQRRAIIHQYNRQNSEIKSRFFKDRVTLFDPPRKNKKVVSKEELLDMKLNTVFEVLYGLYKERNKNG